MSSSTETRGRKAKQVDAEMFKTLAGYYSSKKLSTDVVLEERKLWTFMFRFSINSIHYEALVARYNEIKRNNPGLSHDEIEDILTENPAHNNPFFFARLKKKPTEKHFDDVRREEEMTSANNLRRGYSYFNTADIHKANTLFKQLSAEQSRKLKGRLRKYKHQEGIKWGGKAKKKGIELTWDAYIALKNFTKHYGLDSLSTGLIVMDKMANEHFDGTVQKAIEKSKISGKLGDDAPFAANDTIRQVEAWLNAGLVYEDGDKYGIDYYVACSAFDENAQDGVFKLNHEYATIIRQMKYSLRCFARNETLNSTLMAIDASSALAEVKEQSDIELKLVCSPALFLGGDDRLEQFEQVKTLLKRWDTYEFRAKELLGFEPEKMDFTDLEEVHTRFELILGIDEHLVVTFNNPEILEDIEERHSFMRMENNIGPFNGSSPVNFASRGLEELKATYAFVADTTGVINMINSELDA